MVRRLIASSAGGGSGAASAAASRRPALDKVQTLGEVIGDLIDIAGQHEHQSLLDPAATCRSLIAAWSARAAQRKKEPVAGEPLSEMAAAFLRLEEAIARLRSASL